jgi:hypothetical protein
MALVNGLFNHNREFPDLFEPTTSIILSTVIKQYQNVAGR